MTRTAVRALAKALAVAALAGCQTHGLPFDPFAPFAIPVDPGPGCGPEGDPCPGG